MAHETHHDTNHASSEIKKSTISFRSAFWFVALLAGLFVAAVNFVNVMGHDEGEGHGGGHATEHATEAGHKEHATGETAAPAGEHATEQPAATPAADSAHAESHY